MSDQTYPKQINGTQVPYEATFDELCKNLKTPGPLAWVSCIALARTETSAALDKLIEISQQPDWRFRRAAIEALSYYPQADDVIKVLHRALQDSSQFIVRTACQVIGKLKLAFLHNDIVLLLKSNVPETRQEAIRTLNEIWQEEDFDGVFNLLVSEKVEGVRQQIAWTLRTHTTNQNWHQLFLVWWQDSVACHRRWACELAFQYKARQFERELKTLSVDKDGHVRKIAAKALESLQT